jgi:hypothetical protein
MTTPRRSYTPVTLTEKLIAAHELLADVAQALIDSPDAACYVAARVLANDLKELRDVVATVKRVGL